MLLCYQGHLHNINIKDGLLKNLQKDHSRHCVAGEGDYHGLTGNELGTSEEIGKELRSSRVQDGSQNGGNYQSNRILKESASSHGSATMRALASLVFDTIYSDTNRAASLHRLGAWIGKVNWYAKAADGGGDDGAADAKPGGEQHLHRDRGTFEGTGKKQLGGSVPPPTSVARLMLAC